MALKVAAPVCVALRQTWPGNDDRNMNRRLFCFGYGFSARALAERLRGAGWRIAGTTRDPGKLEALRAEGVEAYLFDTERPLEDPQAALAGATHILASAPPGPAGDPVAAQHAEDIAACDSVEWFGYLSTTGVYGDRGGDWVDEDSALEPTGSRGERRVAAERAWLALQAQHGLPVHLFRLAGIYGPGRNAIETVRDGRAKRIDKPGQVFSRIHVADIATVLEASIARPNPGQAYNLCDDNPAPPEAVIAHACRLLGVEPPPLIPFDAAELSEMARSFYRDNKRVSNQRIKSELGVELLYPDYEAGLAALLAESQSGG